MNKLEWNLQEIFKDEISFYDEIEHIKKKLLDIKKYENIEFDADVLLEVLNKKWYIKELTNNVLIYGSFLYYKDTKSDESKKMKKFVEEFHSEVNTILNFIDQKVIELGREVISEFMKGNPDLKMYKLSFDHVFRLQDHIPNDNMNQLIKENNNSINESLTLYNQLLSDIKYKSIIVDDKVIDITSSNYGKYLSSRNRETRCQTYFSVNCAFEKEQESFANILNSIYDRRIKNADFEKYFSVLEKVLSEENIDVKIIDTLITSVHDHLDLMQEYLKIKAVALNINDPHLYDFGVPLDHGLKIKYSLEEAKEIIFKALEPLGEEYINIVRHLFDGHIDAEPDEKKHQSIIFSWNTYSFMNFRGSYIDLKNMIHEIGHIVNYYLSKEKQPFIYEDSTIFVGETASIINEILLNRYLYQIAKTEEEKVFYLSKEIENYVTSVFKQTMYTEFENDLYNTKKMTNLTPEILCKKYDSIIKKYYGDDMIYDEVSKIEWTRLGHLYRWSYYPYKYATGLLIASVVVDALINSKTLSKEKYLEFLSAGSSKYSLELLKMLDIDLVNSDIITTGFNVMKQDIDELHKILKK